MLNMNRGSYPIIFIITFVFCNVFVSTKRVHSLSKKKPSSQVLQGASCHCSCNFYYSYLEEQLRTLRDSMSSREVRVSIFSEACDDPTVNPDLENCGSSSIQVDGKEYSLKVRGHNVVILNRDGTVWIAKSFDTWDSEDNVIELNNFLLGIPLHKIVLIALQDSTSDDIEKAFPGLESVGADTSDPNIKEFRCAYALMGYKGQAQPWQLQTSAKNGKGPVQVGYTIPLPSDACTLT